MRIKATLSSFVIILALYFVYGWGLVPLVLPTPRNSIDDRTDRSDERDLIRTEEFAPFLDLLPANGWEHNYKDIRLLRFGQIIVLFGKDTPDGIRLRLEPCTILILPDGVEEYGNEESREQILRSVVLRTEQYAEIEFDRDFDITKLPLPNIVSGRLVGTVTVQSGMGESDPNDGFYLETNEIEITEAAHSAKITAKGNVRFSLGLHTGFGTGLALDIVQSDPSQPQASRTLSSASFQNLRSLHLVFPESPNATARLSGDIYVPEGPATTIDVRCQGQFMFVANPAEQGWTASFLQNVEVDRTSPDKSIDRLTAHEVHLTLTPGKQKGNAGAQGNAASPLSGFEPTLFVARGKEGKESQAAVPASLSIAQNGGVKLVGDEIYLDLRRNFLSLSTRQGKGASPHVEMILADQYKIRSVRTLQYTLGQNGAFGKFASEGKGELTGKVGTGASAKDIFLSWNAMQMEPYPAAKDQIVLKLSKGITARMAGFGTMTADSLDLLCNVLPSNSSASTLPGAGIQKSNVLLDHAVVKDKDNVLFETISGTCRVKQLTVFFINVVDGRALYSRWMPQMLTAAPPVSPPVTSYRPVPVSPASQPILQVQYSQPQQNLAPMQPLQLYQPPAASNPATAPAYGNRQPNSLPQTPRPATGTVETQNLLGFKSSPSGGKFEMTGDQMRMQVRIQNGQSFAERVDIEGNVRLKENAANNLAGTPGLIEISGETVMIWNPADPTTTISIQGQATGSDAIFKGKGAELHARELNISRQDNKFWSPGPGRLLANTAQINAPGISTGNADKQLTVEWNKEMVCDGQVLQFEGKPDRDSNRVQVLYQTQTLWCNILEIWLNRRVMFFDDQSTVEPKAVEIKFSRDVNIRNEQFDVQRKRKSINTAKFANLHYDVEKNYFSADGPGELSSVFLGAGQGFDRNTTGTPGVPAKQNNGESLNCLVVWFLNTVQGTMLDSNLTVDIRGRVEAAYYPAASWEDTLARENISAVRWTGYMMECERLQIVEVPDPLNQSQSSMELTASTNSRIDGSGIYASAQKIMYNQAKSTVQMDGNVNLQTTVQGQRVSHPRTESIRYNIETGAVEVIKSQGFGVGQ